VTADRLHERNPLFRKAKVKRTMELMLEAGSRYRNIEKSLGKGVVFLLGVGLAESR